MTTEQQFPDLTEELCKRVRDFVRRTALRMAEREFGCDMATLEISLLQPGGDDDGTLVLEARIEEKTTTDDVQGRVEGVVFP